MKVNKDKYRQLCEERNDIPLFLNYWWIESLVSEKSWDVAIVEDENNDIIGAMPYVINTRCGIIVEISQPKITQYLGVWLKEIKGKNAKKLSKRNAIIKQLIDGIQHFDRMRVGLSPNESFWLPFYWKGFSQTTYYTYTIRDISDLDIVWQNISSSYRNKIRKASKNIIVSNDVSVTDFYGLLKKTFERQSISPPLSNYEFKCHDEELSRRNCRTIFGARDELGRLHSVLYLTYDNERAYVHLVGEDPELRNSSAGILLIWKAIEFASNELETKIFDFEGSMLENVEPVRRDFGALPEEFSVLTHENTFKGVALKIAIGIKKMLVSKRNA